MMGASALAVSSPDVPSPEREELMMLRVFVTILKVLVTTFLAIAIVTTATAAQSAVTTSSNEEAFDKLSPGNQKIAQALFAA